MKITQADLLGMSIEDLRELNSMVVATVKAKRSLEGKAIVNELTVNQEVKVNHSKHTNDIFIIDKINKTKAKVILKGTNKGYTVPFNMIITKW